MELEQFIRWSGGGLQLIGLGFIGWGVGKSRKALGLDPTRAAIARWLKNQAGAQVPYPRQTPRIEEADTSYKVREPRRPYVDKPDDHPPRLPYGADARTLLRYIHQTRSETHRLRGDLHALAEYLRDFEKVETERLAGQTRKVDRYLTDQSVSLRQLEDNVTKVIAHGLRTELIGVVCFFGGIVLATWSLELAELLT